MSPKRNQMAALIVIQNNEGSHERTHVRTRTRSVVLILQRNNGLTRKHGLSWMGGL